MSSRRAVLAGSLASVALSPVAGRAQPATGGPTIGFLVPASGPYIGTPTAVFDSFRRGLADLGHVEGRNIRYEYRSAPDRAGLGEMAAELVRLKVDVLVAAGVAAFIAKRCRRVPQWYSDLAATRYRQGSSTVLPVPEAT